MRPAGTTASRALVLLAVAGALLGQGRFLVAAPVAGARGSDPPADAALSSQEPFVMDLPPLLEPVPGTEAELQPSLRPTRSTSTDAVPVDEVPFLRAYWQGAPSSRPIPLGSLQYEQARDALLAKIEAVTERFHQAKEGRP